MKSHWKRAMGIAASGLLALAASGWAQNETADFDHLLYCTEDAAVRADTPDETFAHSQNNYINEHEWESSDEAESGRLTRRIWLKFELPQFSGTVVNAYFTYARGENPTPGELAVYKASSLQADGVTGWRDEDAGTTTATPSNLTWNRQGTIGAELYRTDVTVSPSTVFTNDDKSHWEFSNPDLCDYIQQAGPGQPITFAFKMWHPSYPDGPWTTNSTGNWWFRNDEYGVANSENRLRPVLAFDTHQPQPPGDYDVIVFPSEDAVVRADSPDTTFKHDQQNYINQHEWQSSNGAESGRLTRRIWLKFELPQFRGMVDNAHFSYRLGYTGLVGDLADGRLAICKADNTLSDGVTPWRDESYGTDTNTSDNITWNRQDAIGEELYRSGSFANPSTVWTNAGNYWEFGNEALQDYLNQAGPGGTVSFAMQLYHKDYLAGPWTDVSAGNWYFRRDEVVVYDVEFWKRPVLVFDLVPRGTLISIR